MQYIPTTNDQQFGAATAHFHDHHLAVGQLGVRLQVGCDAHVGNAIHLRRIDAIDIESRGDENAVGERKPVGRFANSRRGNDANIAWRCDPVLAQNPLISLQDAGRLFNTPARQAA